MEHWKPIPEWKHYEASSAGRIRRRTVGQGTRPGRLLRPRPDRQGYLRLHLGQFSGEQYVHKLVAAAFHGPCPAGKQLDHKNGRKTDNRASNLQYLRPRGHRRKTRRETIMRMIAEACSPYDAVTVACALRQRRWWQTGSILEPPSKDLLLVETLRRRYPYYWLLLKRRSKR